MTIINASDYELNGGWRNTKNKKEDSLLVIGPVQTKQNDDSSHCFLLSFQM